MNTTIKFHFVCKALAVGMCSAALFLSLPFQSRAEEPNLDERIQRLEQRLENLNKQLEQSRTMDVMTVEERLKKLEASRPVQSQAETDWDRIGNMVFFRGGGAWLANGRGNEVFTDVFGQTAPPITVRQDGMSERA